MNRPYILAVVSHKGGTGRTTAALCLAWSFAQVGRSVCFVDADPQRAATLIALNAQGTCPWPNVEYRPNLDALGEPFDGDLVIIDPPPLTDASSRPVMQVADGLVLTCLADPLSIRTVPAAATVIERAQAENPGLSLLGILINIYNDADAVQSAMLSRLKDSHRELLLEPPIPFQPSIRGWPMRPGSNPPDGPALGAYGMLARELEKLTRPIAA